MIEVCGIKKRFFSNGVSTSVLEDVSFSVIEGETVTLIGESGCGKSTLLNIIGGFTQPDDGSVVVDGTVVDKPSKRCVMLFQQLNLLPWRTVLKNVELGLEGEKIPPKEIYLRAYEALNLVGLSDYLHQFPHELSEGMQQRVAIARAFAMEPDVILMDEPFASLDAFNRYFLQEELLRIQSKKKTTIILVTHDIDEAIYLSNRIIIMSSKPCNVFRDMEISLSKPRNRAHGDFLYYRNKILEEFKLSGVQLEVDYSI